MDRLDLLIRDRLELIGIIVTFVIISMSLANSSYAQTPTSAAPVKDFTEALLTKLNHTSTSLAPNPLQVDYESTQSLIMTVRDPYWLDWAGRVIDFAKQKGYTIDSVTVYTDETRISDSTYFDHYFNIFMSKK